MDEIIKKFSKGELSKDILFNNFEKKYGKMVKGFIRSMVPNKTREEDIYQDVALLFFNKISQYELHTNFQAWIMKLTRNCTLRHLEKTQKHEKPQNTIQIETQYKGPGPKTDTINKEQQELVLQALNGLQPIYREILYLRFFCNMSTTDISQVTGTPISTLEKRFQKGLRLIYSVLRSLSPE